MSSSLDHVRNHLLGSLSQSLNVHSKKFSTRQAYDGIAARVTPFQFLKVSAEAPIASAICKLESCNSSRTRSISVRCSLRVLSVSLSLIVFFPVESLAGPRAPRRVVVAYSSGKPLIIAANVASSASCLSWSWSHWPQSISNFIASLIRSLITDGSNASNSQQSIP